MLWPSQIEVSDPRAIGIFLLRASVFGRKGSILISIMPESLTDPDRNRGRARGPTSVKMSLAMGVQLHLLILVAES